MSQWRSPFDDVIPMPYPVCVSIPHRHSWKPWFPCWHHGLGPCRCHGVYYSSWEGLLRSVFVSWVQCFVDMKYNKYTWQEICNAIFSQSDTSRLIPAYTRHRCVPSPRPLDATVEDAETQLCQIVDGFLGINFRVKNQTNIIKNIIK